MMVKIAPDVIERIEKALLEIRQQHQVRILYACESGSRAWEMESVQSDYDVRFIYCRPMWQYLALDVPRDVIERPITDDLDINGWDIFKAARLLRKSNPPLIEWLSSPITYLTHPTINIWRDVALLHYSRQAFFYHYRQMAAGDFRQYIQGKEEVLLKKYLYVLRPVLTLLYLELHQELPPVSMVETLRRVNLPAGVLERIHELLRRKRADDALGMDAPDLVLNEFLERHLERWKSPLSQSERGQFPVELLNRSIRSVLAECEG